MIWPTPLPRKPPSPYLPGLVLGLFVSFAFAQEEVLDVRYAERLPLATRSLLLDIVERPGGGFVAVGERGHVVVSKDGRSWEQAEVVPTRATLTTVTRAGNRLWAGGHDAVIITSGDGGVTWTLQLRDRERQQSVMDLHFFNEHDGLAIGSYGLAMVTDDGGTHWDDTLINEEDWHNNALLAVDDLLLVAGEAGYSYRSEDGGLSWESIEMPYPGSMFGIIGSGAGCAVVFGLRGNAQESCDQGATWVELDTGTELTIAGGVHANGRIVLVGNGGLVLSRPDGGEFQVEKHSSGADFAQAAALESGQYLLIGENGAHLYPESPGTEP